MGIRFGPFILDLDTRQLTREGAEVRLSPKAFALLSMLSADRPKVLTKSSLQERLWPGTFVSEANLSNLVAELRAALDDNPRAPRFIRTVYGFGYAFCGVSSPTRAGGTESDDCSRWLEWDGRRFPLPVGEHLVGRDAEMEIRLDHSTVSRRHARFVVTSDRASLEDFGSKNGTFRGEQRVRRPVELADGDLIRVGSVLLTFHARAPLGTTVTRVEATP